MQFKNVTLPASKRIALVAHDNKKQQLVAWCQRHYQDLQQHMLYATGTTGTVIENSTDLVIHKLVSGPLGGDQQVGAMITRGEVDFLIFFWDPFEPMPHDPDVKALLRIAAVWNIPIACNQVSADFMVASPFFNGEIERSIPDYEHYMQSRA